MCDILQSIARMGSGDNFATYSSEWQHISSVSNGSGEPASTLVFGQRFGSVRVVTRPKT